MKAIIAALALVPVVAIAQDRRLDDQLPAWAARPWAGASATGQLEIFGGINPFFQRGDFDGDGLADLAILVRQKATGKIGILFLHRKGGRALLGAGRAFGNGGDDFAWMDLWSVEDRGPGRGNPGGSGPGVAHRCAHRRQGGRGERPHPLPQRQIHVAAARRLTAGPAREERTHVETITRLAQAIPKREWQRVKRGV